MARQMGLGRGLAALLPHVDHPGAPGSEPPTAATPTAESAAMSDFGTSLVDELAARESGLEVVYGVLDDLVDRFGLHDAALVIDEGVLGPQVFCAGRRPLDEDDETLLTFDPGIYTDPPLETDEVDASLLMNICRIALRLDLLRYDAAHDPLTALYDRRSFDRVLHASIAQSKRYEWPFLLVLIDLDRFKELNDREGHAAGDAELRSLAARFQRTLRFGDTVARIGGDEFALILPDSDPNVLPKLLSRVFSDESALTASFGHAQCPDEGDDYDRLLALADERLYENKAARSAAAQHDEEQS